MFVRLFFIIFLEGVGTVNMQKIAPPPPTLTLIVDIFT